MTAKSSRRGFFKAAGAAGAATVLPATALAQTPQSAVAEPPLTFFTEPEAAFVGAAANRLIPPDERWPGATDAGVVTYIDRQLAGAYGNGARMYLHGPWQEGTPEQGYQLRYTPAQLYRQAISEISQHVGQRFGGKQFGELEAAVQDDVLRGLESGAIELPSVPSAVFFETLLANTIEGFFADPAYGGNRDMVSWRMIGFPGAYAQYVELVEEYDRPFDRPPMSMAQSALRHDH